MTKLWAIIWALLFFANGAKAGAELTLTTTPEHVELAHDTQRICFDKAEGGAFHLTTQVREGASWRPLFDARRPIVEGERFNLEPTSFEVLENSPGRKAVRLSGTHQGPAYPWQLVVEARAESPLIKFVLTCDLPEPLKIRSPQPTVALWMNQTTATLTLDQGPPSQTGTAYEAPYGFGFPAAYLWDAGREAIVFFNMTPMTWFSTTGVYRFIDVQIRTRSQEGRTGLGLHPRRNWGDRIPAGPMVTEFYLYSGAREARPSKFAALDTMLRVCAPLHPAQAEFPKNQFEKTEVSWEEFARNAIRDLMVQGQTCTKVEKPWTDVPLELVKYKDAMIVHPDLLKSDPSVLSHAWNFPTVNHHLAPWMLYARLHPTSETLDLARLKKDAIPRFYDPKTKMIRSFTADRCSEGGMELTWQTLVFYQEMLQVEEALAEEDFNPAILGRLLMGNEGVIDYAHHVNYIFSTYYSPTTHQPLPFFEKKELATLREPWSVGAYSYVMMRSHEITCEPLYQKEAEAALDALLRTMRYTETNKFYTRTFDDPMDMPPSDLTGNAYGIVAAWKLFEQTGDERWRGVSRDFLNTLLRMTPWHEDRTTTASRDLGYAGLFYPFPGGPGTTAWETSEAMLCLAWMLGHDAENPLTTLMLKIANTQRINSFFYYPATWTERVRASQPKLPKPPVGFYFPWEPLNQLEAQGGWSAPYMTGHAIWNWWLYEALGEAADRSVMVLNTASLEGNEEALAGAARMLIAFNPNPEKRATAVRFKSLPPGNYTLTQTGRKGGKKRAVAFSEGQLSAGILIELESLEAVRLELRREDDGAALAHIESTRTARRRLAHAYQLLQQRAQAMKAGDRDAEQNIQEQKERFLAAMQAYRSRDLAGATRQAEAILIRLGAPGSEPKF